MTVELQYSRRALFKITALAGGGLTVSWVTSKAGALAPGLLESQAFAASSAENFLLSPFLRIYPDNSVEFILDRVEMGQGTATSQAMLLCEELDFPVDNVRIAHAGVSSVYNNTLFRAQMTGGSTSVAEGHEKLRRAGAEIRERLRLAAAAQWKTSIENVKASAGRLLNTQDQSLELTYGAIASQAANVDAPSVQLKDWSEHATTGRSVVRLDAQEKSTGQAVFSIDFAPPDALVAGLIRPPRPGDVLEKFDTDVAKKVPGVLAVVAAAGGVAVVAQRYWQVKKALGLVQVEWNSSQAMRLSSSELEERHVKLSLQDGDSVRKSGDWATAHRNSGKKLKSDYLLPYLAHATMEPPNAAVRYDLAGSKLEIWSSCQSPDTARELVADALGLERSAVIFHNTYLGGGFGRRLNPDYIVEAAQVAAAIKDVLSGKALQLVWSREDDLQHDDYRPMAACHVMGSLDDQGKLSSFFFRQASQSLLKSFAPMTIQTIAPEWLPKGISSALGSAASYFGSSYIALEGVADFPYSCPNLGIEYVEVDLPIRVGFWRSVGHSINAFVVESFMDEMAHLAGVDPYRFRRAHLSDDDRRARVLDQVVRTAKWGEPLPEGIFEGLAVHKSFESYVAEIVRISFKENKLIVHEVYCAVDCGRVVNPMIVEAQMRSGILYGLSAALNGEVPFEDGRPQVNNFNDYPVLRHEQAPTIHVEIIQSEHPPTGVGEPGTPPIAPALCNAIFRASGKRIHRLPLSRSLT